VAVTNDNSDDKICERFLWFTKTDGPSGAGLTNVTSTPYILPIPDNSHLSFTPTSGVPRGGMFNPPPEIPKALQNRAKLNPIVKTVKNC